MLMRTRPSLAVLWLALTFLAVVIPPAGAAAQNQEPVTNAVVTYVFGHSITIRAERPATAEPADISIRIDLPGSPRSLTERMVPNAAGQLQYEHSLEQGFIQAFSTVEFHFMATLPGGEFWESPTYRFYYADNRFNWQTIERGPFRLHWYAGDAAFAQDAMDAAHDGMARANAILQTEIPEMVEIYVYASLDDYQFTRGQLGQLWAGGHADPAAGLIILSLPPGEEQQLEIERKLPHEVAHVMLYQRAGEGFGNIPGWLNEGFASMIETFPNPDFEYLVSVGLQSAELIPMAELCGGFPTNPAVAQLAYAESTSFVEYLHEVYGAAGLRGLIDSYSAGAGCPTGTLVDPIQLDLETLEGNWIVEQRPLADPPAQPEVAEALPWLLIAAATLAGPIVLLAGTVLRKK